MSNPRPPRWLEGLLTRALPHGLSGQGTLGDLAEEFARRSSRSRPGALAWYLGQALSILGYRLLSGSGTESSATDSDLLMDIRWSLRAMLRHPGFTVGVVAVLGLGLGTNAAVFSVVDGTLRNSTWWEDPDRTLAIWPDRKFSFGHLELYREDQSAYEAVGGYVELAFALQTADGESQSVNGVLISPEIFRRLAAQPVVGRALADDDALLGVERVVVIGEGLWRRSFGGDPNVVGARIDVGGAPATVVGVQRIGGRAPGGRTELWLPLVMDPRDDDFWKAQSHVLIGVLRPGADEDDAAAELMAYTQRLSELFPMFYPDGWADGIATVARADQTQRRLVSTPLLLLLGGTALLLIVTALNVGNLLLGRAVDRRKELAVRTALGAGRMRIARQLLVEGMVLTGLALAVGLMAGSVGGRWIATLFTGQAIVASSSVLSPSVFVFSVGIAGLAWIVLNGVPLAHFLRSQRRGPTVAPDSGARVQRSLVSVQAALAMLLLVTATLLAATVDNLRSIPLGFEPDGLLTFELSPPEDRVGSVPAARDLYDGLTDAVAALPGVGSVGLTGWLPLRAQAPETPINPRAAPVDPREAVTAPLHMVDPGFFETFALAPRVGRTLTLEDRKGGPSAVVVNRTLADLLWPDGTAIGRMIAIDPHAWDSWVPVVGVVPDLRSGDITGPIGPALYVSLAESPSRDVTLVVHAEPGARGLSTMIQRTIRDVDPLVPIRAVSEMTEVVRAAYALSWVMMGLLVILAALATALGAIGIYGVLAHHVLVSRKEIGVRLALGAQPVSLIRSIVRSGLVLAGVGIAAGCLAAAFSARFLDSLLFEVSALAPVAYVGPALALGLVAGVAAWIPAARAGRLPPAEALRCD